MPTASTEVPDLPAWASGETLTVGSDTGPIELPVELVSFCESSRSFYIAAKGLDYVTAAQFGATQQLFAALTALLPDVIDTAPSEEFAAEPLLASEQLAVLIPALEQVGYDTSKIGALPEAAAVFDAVAAFGDGRNSLNDFLLQACGADQAVLDEAARGAAVYAAETAGETVEPAEPATAADGVPIATADSTITVSVPADWTDVEEVMLDGRTSLVASPDFDGFSDLATPGVLILRGEGGFRDGGFVGRVLELQADLELRGCVLADETSYVDNTYTGQERIYSCGDEALDVRVFGGATDDESLYAMVLLVSPAGDLSIRQLIVETFLVA